MNAPTLASILREASADLARSNADAARQKAIREWEMFKKLIEDWTFPNMIGFASDYAGERADDCQGEEQKDYEFVQSLLDACVRATDLPYDNEHRRSNRAERLKELILTLQEIKP